MALYAWTIRVPNREPIERVSGIDELHQTLTVLDLPGAPSPLGITADADGIVPDNGKFQHVATPISVIGDLLSDRGIAAPASNNPQL